MTKFTVACMIVILCISGAGYCTHYLFQTKKLFGIYAIILLGIMGGYYVLLCQKYSICQYLLTLLITMFFLIVLSFIDIWRKKIPIELLIVGGLTSILFLWANLETMFISHLLSCFLFCILGNVMHKLVRGGIGKGDGYVIGLIGLYCGFEMAVTVVFFSVFICGCVSIILLAFKKAKRKTPLPFVPFMAIGYMLILL